MKRFFLSALFLSTTLSLFSNTLYIRDFPLMRKAKLKGTPGNIAAIPFDDKFYKNTNNDYSNIRIIEDNGKNVPFSVRNIYPFINKTIYISLHITADDFHLDKTDKTANIKLSLKFPAQISRISLPMDNMLKNVRISLNFFNQKDQIIGKDKIFQLNTSDNTKKEIHIDFPAVKTDSILVSVISQNKFDPEALENLLKKIQVKQAVTLKIPGAPKTITVQLHEISRINKGSLTEITCAANKIPCTALNIVCENPKYKRYVEVFSKTGTAEKCIASQMLSRNESTISLPEVRGEYYIIRIHNGAEPPLKNIRLHWEAKERVMMFIPPEKGDLKIYYGGNARVRSYDIEFAERHGLPPQIYELEEESESPDYEPQIPTIDLYKYFMWIVIVTAAMLFFLMVVRMINKRKDPVADRKE